MKKLHSRWRRLAGVALAAFLLLMLLRWFEHAQIYFPGRTLQGGPADFGRGGEEVWLTTKDGVKINAWFLPAKADAPRQQWVILQCHGNAGNISHRGHYYEAFRELGVNVFAFDYRGYGRSEGRPSEEGTYLDAQAACGWLRERGFAPEHIIAYGESLGGGIASELAVREQVGGLVLQSTFTSIPDIGAELFPWLPVRWLATIHYDTRSKLPRIKVPVLVMHSRADEIIGFQHGEALFQAANEPKLFVELADGHNEPLEGGRNQFLAGLQRHFELLKKKP